MRKVASYFLFLTIAGTSGVSFSQPAEKPTPPANAAAATPQPPNSGGSNAPANNATVGAAAADPAGAATTAPGGAATTAPGGAATTAPAGAAPTDPASGSPAAAKVPAAGGQPCGVAKGAAAEDPPILTLPPRTDLSEHSGKNYWMPPQASTNAADVDWLYYGILGLSIFCFVAITIITVYFAWRYRQRPGHKADPNVSTHNDALEITWTVIPSIICVIIFVIGWKGFLNQQTAPKHAIEIGVLAQKWKWTFEYRHDGKTFSSDELHVPVGQPVRLTMRARDVLHSFWVPAFRIKQDVIPNRYTQLWFEAKTPGVYRMYCAEYCGTDHSNMKTYTQVHESGGFEQWLAAKAEKEDSLCGADRGKARYVDKGCNQCHSIDGKDGKGPTWKGIWGKNRPLANGSTVLVDENYIRESILEPNAKTSATFSPIMPSFKGQLKDADIDGIIEYIKSLQ